MISDGDWPGGEGEGGDYLLIAHQNYIVAGGRGREVCLLIASKLHHSKKVPKELQFNKISKKNGRNKQQNSIYVTFDSMTCKKIVF